MTTKAGVGYSENPQSRDAGVEAARAAMAEAGVDTVDLALIYQTAKHDPAQFQEGVRAVVGPAARLIGGYAGGIITRCHLGYDGYQCGVAVLSSRTVKAALCIEHGLKEFGEVEVGRRLGQQIKSHPYGGEPGLIYMYDSVKNFSAAGIDLNIGTYLIEGITASLGRWPAA